MDKEEFEKAVLENCTKKATLESLGYRAAGGNYDKFDKCVRLWNVDISHFKTHKDFTPKNKIIPLEECLVEHSTYSRKDMKRRLYTCELKERRCELCGQDENWNGRKMSLILDHINGVWNDNRIENLRIVCPNCNATLDTHAGKNHKNRKIKVAKDPLRRRLAGIKRRKVERPTEEILLSQIRELGFCGTARIYGVSDNAIRKWLKFK